jgi:hypothetical protein
MEFIKFANIALRFIMELCVLAALSYWGLHTGKGFPSKLGLALLLPLAAAVIWGMFVSPKASFPAAGWLRLLIELSFFGSAAVALYAAGHTKLALSFAIVSVINLTFIYIWKQ